MTDRKKYLSTREAAKHVGLALATTDSTFGDPLDTEENITGGTGVRLVAALPLGRRPGRLDAAVQCDAVHGHGRHRRWRRHRPSRHGDRMTGDL